MRKIIISLLILFLVHLFLLIFLKFTAWPEMIVRPYLLLEGRFPYRDFLMEHNPLLIFDLAIFNKIFGIGLIQLKIYTWIWIFLTDITVFFVAKKLWGVKISLFALAFYIPLQILYEGNGLWFDLALSPLLLLTYFFLKTKKYIWAGVILSLAFFIKQTAFWIGIPVFLYLLKEIRKKDFKNTLQITEGFLAVTALIFVGMTVMGILPDFFNWAFGFGIFYLPRNAGQIILPTLKQFLVSFFPFILVLPLLFLNKKKDSDIPIWTFFAVLGVYPRFEYFHFQPSLPFLAIGGALSFSQIIGKKSKFFKLLILGYFLILIFLFGRFIYRNWNKEDRFYGRNEENVSSFVKSVVTPGEKIYVLNYWDSIYATTLTLPATKPLVPFLPWYLEYQGLKDEIVKNLITDMPEVILKGDYSEQGLGSYRVYEIEELLERYYALSYKSGGVEVYILNK